MGLCLCVGVFSPFQIYTISVNAFKCARLSSCVSSVKEQDRLLAVQRKLLRKWLDRWMKRNHSNSKRAS